jgi:hypothetical protein
MGSIAHNQAAIMKYIFEQAKPLIGNYSQLKNDYIDRLFRNEVSQPVQDIGRLTNNLYSSIKPAMIKSDNLYNTTKTSHQSYSKQTPNVYSRKKDYSERTY